MKQLHVFPRKLRTYLLLIPTVLPLHMTVQLISFGPFWTTLYKVMLSQKLILNNFFLHRESCALSPIEDIKQFFGLQRTSFLTNRFWANQEFIKAYIVSFLVRERGKGKNDEQGTKPCFRSLCLHLSNFIQGLSLPSAFFVCIFFWHCTALLLTVCRIQIFLFFF